MGCFIVGRKLDFAYVGQSNSRIGEFAFQDGFYFFAQGLTQSPLVIFLAALLRHGTHSKTEENTRKDGKKYARYEEVFLMRLDVFQKGIRYLGPAIVGDTHR